MPGWLGFCRDLDEPAVGGPAGQLVAVGQLQFTQHAAHMRLDGLDRDEQLSCDLLVRVAACDEPEHLTLTLGQSIEIFINRGKINRPGEGIQHESGQARREDRVAFSHPADRVNQLAATDRFRHVASGTRTDDTNDVLGGIRDRQCEEFLFRIFLVHLADDLHATTARQVHVQQPPPRLCLQHDGNGTIGIGCLADNGYRTADLGLDAGAEHGMVVDDHDTVRPVFDARALGIGLAGGPQSAGLVRSLVHLLISSRTSGPSPGAERTGALPPCRAMRSMMLPLTPMRSSATASTSNPFPRSLTKTSTVSSSTSA